MQRKAIYPVLFSALMVIALLIGVTSASAQTGTAVWGPDSVPSKVKGAAATSSLVVVNGVPVKAFHLKAMGKSFECKTCHQSAVPTQRPDDLSLIHI